LDALKDIQAPAAAIPLQRVGGVGNLLEFAQHEVRNHENPVKETGFANIRDPAVDHNAGVENLVRLLGRPFSSKDAAKRRQIQQVPFIRPYHQPNVSHQEKDKELDKGERAGVENGIRQHVADERRSDNTHDRADCGANETLQGCSLESVLEVDDAGRAA